MQNSREVLEEFRVLLHFMIVQCCHNFHFKGVFDYNETETGFRNHVVCFAKWNQIRETANPAQELDGDCHGNI